jgi:hypothetical protein
MTTAQQQVRQLRQELIASGADPFEVAALALDQAARYREQINQLQQTARVMWMRPPATVFCRQKPADCRSRQMV